MNSLAVGNGKTTPEARVRIGAGQIAIVCIVTFFWATCFPLIETGHRAAPPLEFAAIRSLIAGCSIIIPALFFSRAWIFDRTIWVYALAISLTYTVIGFGGMFLADGRVTPGIATVLTNTQPIIAAILAFYFLSERMSKKNIFGLFISFSGIVLIASKSFTDGFTGGAFIGLLFVLAGAFGTGAGNVLMKKSTKNCNPYILTGLQFLLGSMILFTLSYLFESQKAINWHPAFTWSLIILAIPGTSLATVLWLLLLKNIPLTKLNMYTFLTPAFGIAIGYFFFEERYVYSDVFGIILALIGIYLATAKTYNTPQRGPTL